MTGLNDQALEQTAESYEELFVPTLFEGWARRVADMAELRPGQAVLDVACGTGILARTVAERVRPGGTVAGADINPGMLGVARRQAPGIDWRQGAAEALPFKDESFDAVVSQFGMMFFSDPEAALEDMMRVLKPGGRLAVCVFDSLDQQPAYDALADVFDRVVGESVGNALRSPFAMGEVDALAALCARAGASHAVIESHQEQVRFPSVRNMVLADVKGWFPIAQIHLDDQTLDTVIQEAETALTDFTDSDGTVAFPTRAHIITATKTSI